VFDTKTWKIIAKVDTGRAPFFGVCPVWLMISPDGSRLYVLAEEGDNVLVIDTAAGQVIDVISLSE